LPDDKKFKLPKSENIRPALEYSSLGIQIAVLVGGAAYLGKWLDLKYHTNKPWFALALVLLAVALSIYYTIRQLNNMNNRKP
jgi:F0F1-type ATP synthase assembly protein I